MNVDREVSIEDMEKSMKNKKGVKSGLTNSAGCMGSMESVGKVR